MRQILFVLFITLNPTLAFSEWGDFSGSELIDRCRNTFKVGENKAEKEQFVFDQGVCLGYLHGIKQMLNRTDINYPPELPKSCIPEGVSQKMQLNAIYSYAKAAPYLLNYDATTLVVIAWSKGFPCDAK